MTAASLVRLFSIIGACLDVGDGVRDGSGPHEADAISPEQRGEHIDDIVVILDHEQSPTGKFTKIATVHGYSGSSSRPA